MSSLTNIHMRLDILDISDIIGIPLEDLDITMDEDVDIYMIRNDIDDLTEKELRFINKAFSIYFMSAYDKHCKNITVIDLTNTLKDFDTSVELISSGVFGSGFNSKAINIYKNLRTISKLYNFIEQKSIRKSKEKPSIAPIPVYDPCGGGRSYGSC